MLFGVDAGVILREFLRIALKHLAMIDEEQNHLAATCKNSLLAVKTHFLSKTIDKK